MLNVLAWCPVGYSVAFLSDAECLGLLPCVLEYDAPPDAECLGLLPSVLEYDAPP
jgi:hypothetical protein